jgi:ubiquitin-like-conjugating enzyme ATG3
MSSFIPNILVQSFHSARDYLTPVLTTSQFIEKGQITPEEFVTAGDYLIRFSPSWAWTRGNTDCLKTYLPPDKQFLTLRNIACRSRAKSMESKHVDDFDFAVDDHVLPPSPVTETDTDSDYEDMPAAYTPTAPDVVSASTDIRYYEMTIVYDNYYRTPRIFIRGETVDGRPLYPDEVMDDIMQDYVNKTATIDPHPHTGVHYVGIHPCRHAQTMKRILDTFSSQNKGKYPEIHSYMFIFLKFINSMIPTLEYDLTMPISTST